MKEVTGITESNLSSEIIPSGTHSVSKSLSGTYYENISGSIRKGEAEGNIELEFNFSNANVNLKELVVTKTVNDNTYDTVTTYDTVRYYQSKQLGGIISDNKFFKQGLEIPGLQQQRKLYSKNRR